MVSTSFMVDTSSHPRAQLHRCVERSAYVRTELVRDHHARRRAGVFQQLLHEPLRSAFGAGSRRRERSHFLVDSAPKPSCLPAIEKALLQNYGVTT